MVMGAVVTDELDRMPTRLKLTAIRNPRPARLRARRGCAGEMTLRDALAFPCQREIARRERAIVRHWSEDNGERRIDMSFGLAKFPFVRDPGGFDFAARPSLDRGQIRDLATGRFIANGDALLVLGPPGTGKSHLAVALGREAIIAGYTVLITGAMERVANLAKAQADGRLEERLTHHAEPRLLIVDDLDYLPLEADAARPFFQLVSRRNGRRAMLVTSHRAVGEWGTVFGDAVVAAAILDRLLHHSHVITVRGDSYRLRRKAPQRAFAKPRCGARNHNRFNMRVGQSFMSTPANSECRSTWHDTPARPGWVNCPKGVLGRRCAPRLGCINLRDRDLVESSLAQF
ncbi:IS21-like element helper ATPase IstB [Loktanella sp. DJP18]|uniref:IS21-like element helper ATPase IstB n=1 Tax=Loktanella sp. DJP18 TaxID=3409788 RepID=UPI003BB73F46